jgi:hypothetical protein
MPDYWYDMIVKNSWRPHSSPGITVNGGVNRYHDQFDLVYKNADWGGVKRMYIWFEPKEDKLRVSYLLPITSHIDSDSQLLSVLEGNFAHEERFPYRELDLAQLLREGSIVHDRHNTKKRLIEWGNASLLLWYDMTGFWRDTDNSPKYHNGVFSLDSFSPHVPSGRTYSLSISKIVDEPSIYVPPSHYTVFYSKAYNDTSSNIQYAIAVWNTADGIHANSVVEKHADVGSEAELLEIMRLNVRCYNFK